VEDLLEYNRGDMSRFLGGREGAKELSERGRKDAVRIGSGPNISSLAWPPDAIEISGTNGNAGGGS